MRNMPVVEGLKLLTADGYAEVEFDDTSRLRLTPSTSVRFPRLVLRSTGAQSSAIRLDVGTIYVNLQDTKNNDFTLIVGSRKITVNRSTHLRLSFFDSAAELAVFSGSAVVQSNAAPVVVAKKQTLVMDALGSGPGQLENNLKEGTYDDWEENVMKYHEHHPRRAAGGRWDYF
ncbi:FecR domain-containing protein [Edaphobacter aggregans]|uniref:FecR domain-containing protein n=1 Tax=Edaphobacter aggregans TaxID=570835 RepID=UPI00147067B0|nr:FecR domain-containing protein [Edaphobacter aggregans]